jgi:hypothetical protein
MVTFPIRLDTPSGDPALVVRAIGSVARTGLVSRFRSDQW